MNYSPIIGVVIISFLLGWLWHSPALFGRLWMRLQGFTPEAMKKDMKLSMAQAMVGGLASTVVFVAVTNHFVTVAGTVTLIDALRLAGWIWLGYVVTIMANSVLWENRSAKLYVFNIVYQFVSLAVAATLLTLWR